MLNVGTQVVVCVNVHTDYLATKQWVCHYILVTQLNPRFAPNVKMPDNDPHGLVETSRLRVAWSTMARCFACKLNRNYGDLLSLRHFPFALRDQAHIVPSFTHCRASVLETRP